MLSVTMAWRRRGIARKLVEHAMRAMEADGVDEVCRTNLFLSSHQIMLETEYDNAPSLALYSALGFVREKRLHRFYSNGKDA
jgi:peptide alpha-N-acetyltransferase